MPIPAMQWAISAPIRVFSINMPHIFLLSAYMSLGHLIDILLPGSIGRSTDTMARVTACDMRNWQRAGMPFGFISMLNDRFLPGSASHVLPRCPRPAF
jgi:predicted cation transporter